MSSLPLDPISFQVSKIAVLSEETCAPLGAATGFFLFFHEQYFLVTAWHVVSGRHFQTKEPLHHSLALPGTIECSYSIIRSISAEGEFEVAPNVGHFSIDVSGDWLSGNHSIHPDFGSDVDVVAINVTQNVKEALPHGFDFCCFKSEDVAVGEAVAVMDQVFIPGYPDLRVQPPNRGPIYKSCFISTEPNFFEGKPYVFLDGKTKAGWSGSPVLHSRAMKFGDFSKGEFLKGPSRRLYAVYSGRDESDKNLVNAELGYAWPIDLCVMPIVAANL